MYNEQLTINNPKSAKHSHLRLLGRAAGTAKANRICGPAVGLSALSFLGQALQPAKKGYRCPSLTRGSLKI